MNLKHSLAAAIRFALAGSLASATLGVHAQDGSTDRVLETVRVSASAVNEDPANLAAPFSILEGNALFERSQSTLGIR